MSKNVILVDLENNQIGVEEKILAHKKKLLHRAFSIFLFNDKNEILLQKRAPHKYHSGNLWTNTCCSHQREGESNLEAGNRRMIEEMGMTVSLQELFTFVYKAYFDNGLSIVKSQYGSSYGNPSLSFDFHKITSNSFFYLIGFYCSGLLDCSSI